MRETYEVTIRNAWSMVHLQVTAEAKIEGMPVAEPTHEQWLQIAHILAPGMNAIVNIGQKEVTP